MFIDRKAHCNGADDFERFESADYRIYWRGLLYSSGVSAGLPCITKLAVDLRLHNLQQLAPALRGSFLLIVQEKQSEDFFVLVDNSGLYHAFYSDAGFSTSFLDLAAFQGLGADDLDPEALVEFLHFGFVSFDRTLFRDIRKLPPEQILRISPVSGISLIPKFLAEMGSRSPSSLEELLQDFTSCVSAERVSVDITGGMDTRFLAILLHYYGLNFEVAVRGNENDLDVKIAGEVAAALGKDLNVCHPVIDDMESQFPHVLEICDGLFDVVRSYGALQLQYERARRDITLMVSAGGGELYRDHFWLQDFPFYSRKKANLKRFCSFRLLPTDPDHSLLAAEYGEISRGYRSRLFEDLSQYEVAGNTQTYDRIVYRVRYRELLGRYVTNHTHVMRCAMPFMERDAVMYGDLMPRSDRFFDYYFRGKATNCNPQAARIRTTRGNVTLSSEFFPLAGDVYKYGADKLTRISRRIGQKYFKKSYRSCGKLDEPLGHPDLFSTLRRSQAVRQSASRLQDMGILNSALGVEDLGDQYLGTTLTLALVMERLDQVSRSRELQEVTDPIGR
ncbi:MAG: hypothetical protein ACRD20_13870 [Terriglobales bacterium]